MFRMCGSDIGADKDEYTYGNRKNSAGEQKGKVLDFIWGKELAYINMDEDAIESWCQKVENDESYFSSDRRIFFENFSVLRYERLTVNTQKVDLIPVEE